MHRRTTAARSTSPSSLRARAILSLTLLPLLAACATTTVVPAEQTSLPTDEVTLSDLDGRTLSSPLVIEIMAEPEVREVRFLLNGELLAVVDEAPFRVELDPARLGEGSHDLVAESVDGNGHVGERASASFDVPASDGTEPLPAVPPLTWAPPELHEPTTITIGALGSIPALDRGRDYILIMPATPRGEGVVINGGRNVVLLGGEIAIDDQGTTPTINARRGLYIANSTGVVHVEGLLIHGTDLSEGIQINAPQAIVQLQNVAVRNVHARDQVGFTDNHPDVIQTWGSVRELRVDGFTGETDYQGIFFKADYNGPHGAVHLRRVNMRAMPTTRYQVWMDDRGGRYPSVTFDDVWVEPRPGGRFEKSIWPDVDHPRHAPVIEDGTASWPSLEVEGSVHEGVPPEGDFVPVTSVGLGYTSPGYASTP
jgi:hypothetical protein